MRSLLFIVLGYWNLAYGQQEYFTTQVKSVGLEYFQKQIYAGCADPKNMQEMVSETEMKRLTEESQSIVEKQFSQAFRENPKVKESFRKDLKALTQDPSCQEMFNHCRARLLSLNLYYYQQFRADVSECKKDSSTPQCDVEKKYRLKSFEGVHSTNYGAAGIGSYRRQLLKEKNDTTRKLFDLIMLKGKNSYHICDTVLRGEAYRYHLDMEEPGGFDTDLDPEYHLAKNIPKNCVDEKKVIHQEFIRTSIDEGRFKVGLDDVEPVKKTLSDLIKNNPNFIITDIAVTANSAKLPLYVSENGKKRLDPKSEERNLQLAKDRSEFLSKIMDELKRGHSQLEKVKFTVKGELAGPAFEPMDLNDRFVTHMTPGYLERVFATFTNNKRLYKEVALMEKVDELTEQTKFGNLYQVKFKPFQGFRIIVSGFKKEEMKCLDQSEKPKTPSSSSKQ